MLRLPLLLFSAADDPSGVSVLVNNSSSSNNSNSNNLNGNNRVSGSPPLQPAPSPELSPEVRSQVNETCSGASVDDRLMLLLLLPHISHEAAIGAAAVTAAAAFLFSCICFDKAAVAGALHCCSAVFQHSIS